MNVFIIGLKGKMKFEMKDIIADRVVKTFTETTAPDWLTSKNTIKGSTMDQRWYWEDYVLKLAVGDSVETDFNVITRVA
jgi:hypothetical protein